MGDWFNSISNTAGMEQIGFLPFLGIMGISLISSFLISFLYVTFYKARSTGSLIYRAFPLLSISITAIFITIQFSLPLSLGLLGALSIVRFRTPIKEPEEIGFIMLVVASALCCATFNLQFLAIVLIIALAALFLNAIRGGIFELSQNNGMVILTIPKEKYDSIKEQLQELIEQSLPVNRLDSLVEEETKITFTYNTLNSKNSDIIALQTLCSKLDGSIQISVYNNSVVI